MFYLQITQVEKGLDGLGVATIAELREALPVMRSMLANTRLAKRIYSFAFDFSLEENMRGLHMEVAVELWKILLKDQFGLLEPFTNYIQDSSMKTVSKDLWSMVTANCSLHRCLENSRSNLIIVHKIIGNSKFPAA